MIIGLDQHSFVIDSTIFEFWANDNDQPAEVTLNGGLVRESPQNSVNSGLGIILICPDECDGNWNN